MSKSPAVKIARVNRLLEELEHDDVAEALKHAIEMRRALRVIHTWVAFPPLDAGDVREIIFKALRMQKP